MSGSLQNKVALITGVGRDQGIGAALCRRLAAQGADIFFTFWHQYDGLLFPVGQQIDPDVFADELRRCKVNVAYAEIDLSQAASPTKLFQNVERQLGKPTVLINNACCDYNIAFTELSEEQLDQHYAVNVRATTMLCKEFVKNGPPGHIINMTSGQDLGPMGSDKIRYTITKASVEMLTAQLAPDLAKQGITINALDPGPTDTGWMTNELKAQIIKESKRGRVNTPTDVADLVAKLLADDKTTGQIIHAER